MTAYVLSSCLAKPLTTLRVTAQDEEILNGFEPAQYHYWEIIEKANISKFH